MFFGFLWRTFNNSVGKSLWCPLWWVLESIVSSLLWISWLHISDNLVGAWWHLHCGTPLVVIIELSIPAMKTGESGEPKQCDNVNNVLLPHCSLLANKYTKVNGSVNSGSKDEWIFSIHHSVPSKNLFLTSNGCILEFDAFIKTVNTTVTVIIGMIIFNIYLLAFINCIIINVFIIILMATFFKINCNQRPVLTPIWKIETLWIFFSRNLNYKCE